MSYAQESGYTPLSVEALMSLVKDNVNTQFGTSYTDETFVGTNLYKYFYALIQKLQENEVKTSEIFVKLQEFFTVTNARIARPVVTPNGLIEKFVSEGYLASVKPSEDADAGKIFVCVDKEVEEGNWEDSDDYEDDKVAVCELLSTLVVGGVVSQGSESEAIVLTNGQSFDFKYALPNRIVPDLRLTITLSENNQLLIGNPDDVKLALIANIAERYALGKNFEPQRYFSIVDAPWAESVLLEYDIGGGFTDEVYDAEFDDLFQCDLENLELVEE